MRLLVEVEKIDACKYMMYIKSGRLYQHMSRSRLLHCFGMAFGRVV